MFMNVEFLIPGTTTHLLSSVNKARFQISFADCVSFSAKINEHFSPALCAFSQ